MCLTIRYILLIQTPSLSPILLRSSRISRHSRVFLMPILCPPINSTSHAIVTPSTPPTTSHLSSSTTHPNPLLPSSSMSTSSLHMSTSPHPTIPPSPLPILVPLSLMSTPSSHPSTHCIGPPRP